MAKLTLNTLASGHLDVELVNENFARIVAFLETVLSRDGTSPNQMEADLDLNGYALLNSTVNPSNPVSLVTQAAMEAYVDSRASGVVQQQQQTFTATAGQTVLTLTDFVYTAGANNLAVYVDGVRRFAPNDYVETSPTVVTLVSPLAGGEEVQLVVNEFLGTVTLPVHTHTWSALVDPPATATRWPSYTEVTDKPATFAPSAHTHSAADVTSGRLADAHRGVFVQSGAPSSPVVGDLWFW